MYHVAKYKLSLFTVLTPPLLTISQNQYGTGMYGYREIAFFWYLKSLPYINIHAIASRVTKFHTQT